MEDTHKSPRSSTKEQKLRKAMVKNFYECIFEDTLVSVILKFHRELAIGKSTGICEDEEDDPTLSTSSTEHYDIFDHETSNGSSKRSVECKCFVCHRLIAATRFMPHLEKCIGIGRNSRVTRRKVPNYVEHQPVSLPLYNKLTNNTRARSTSSNLVTDLLEDDEDEEWSNSTNNSRKRPKTRSTRRAKNTG